MMKWRNEMPIPWLLPIFFSTGIRLTYKYEPGYLADACYGLCNVNTWLFWFALRSDTSDTVLVATTRYQRRGARGRALFRHFREAQAFIVILGVSL